jgi:anti-sigma B factor antagonist
MKFKVEKKNDSVYLKLSEKRLDSNIASKLKAEFLILSTEDVKYFYIDLSEVEFCDSSGLSSLLITQRHTQQVGGKSILVGCKENVIKLIKISQLDRVFEFKDKIKKEKKEKTVKKENDKKTAVKKSVKKIK